MFTGIVETVGKIREIRKEGSNIHFCVNSHLAPELKVDQSVAHNGVCLTVTEVGTDCYWVTAVDETLRKTQLNTWIVGSVINLERCLKVGDRLDGHMVQGHVDMTGVCENISSKNGSWILDFSFEPQATHHVVVEKGSICINGVSLTAFNTSKPGRFSVTLIPYTMENTQFIVMKKGERVNLEFDILGKYIAKMFPGQ